MIRAAMSLVGLLGALAVVPPASAEGNSDYSVLMISRERLEVASSCEIGIYPVSYTHLTLPTKA